MIVRERVSCHRRCTPCRAVRIRPDRLPNRRLRVLWPWMFVDTVQAGLTPTAVTRQWTGERVCPQSGVCPQRPQGAVAAYLRFSRPSPVGRDPAPFLLLSQAMGAGPSVDDDGVGQGDAEEKNPLVLGNRPAFQAPASRKKFLPVRPGSKQSRRATVSWDGPVVPGPDGVEAISLDNVDLVGPADDCPRCLGGSKVLVIPPRHKSLSGCCCHSFCANCWLAFTPLAGTASVDGIVCPRVRPLTVPCCPLAGADRTTYTCPCTYAVCRISREYALAVRMVAHQVLQFTHRLPQECWVCHIEFKPQWTSDEFENLKERVPSTSVGEPCPCTWGCCHTCWWKAIRSSEWEGTDSPSP